MGPVEQKVLKQEDEIKVKEWVWGGITNTKGLWKNAKHTTGDAF